MAISDILKQVGQSAAENVSETGREIYSTRPQAKYASGARCILKVNGEIVAFATAVSWRITTDSREIRTIDEPLPVELVPSTISVDGSIGGLRIPNQSPAQNLMMPDILAFLFHKYITIEVRDSKTDALLFLTGKAQITGRTEDVRSEALASVSLTWKAIGWRDERNPEYPRGYSQDEQDRLADKTKTQPPSTNQGPLEIIRQQVGSALTSMADIPIIGKPLSKLGIPKKVF